MTKFKKYIAALLCVDILLSGSPVALFAAEISNISGVTPENGVYNITAEKIESDTGFRSYDQFQLSKDNTANLIYTSYDKFINLVQDQVRIDGLLNTMKDGVFYNGHAIFVSPNGIVIGADGMINVGKLSLISTDTASFGQLRNAFDAGNLSNFVPTASGYKNLITNASGDVVINGKILTSTTADIHAGNIDVSKKGTDKTTESYGIITAPEGTDRNYTDRKAASDAFNSLVNGGINGGKPSYSVENGVVIISNASLDAKEDVNIRSDVSLDLEKKKIIDDVVMAELTTNEQRKLGTSVVLDNAQVSGGNVNISASSFSEGYTNLGKVTEVGATWSNIWDWLMSEYDPDNPEQLDQRIATLFSSEVYKDFTGGKSYAEVVIGNESSVTSTGDLNVSTDAKSNFTVENASETLPDFLYALGTETKSKVSIDGSSLEADGKISVDASSSNNLVLNNIVRNKGLFLLDTSAKSDAYNFSYFNFSSIADTGVDINNSTITATGEHSAKEATVPTVSISSRANIDENIVVKNTATVGKKEDGSPLYGDVDAEGNSTGGSGAVVSFFVNNVDADNNINIQDSIVESKNGDLSVKVSGAENLSTKNIVSTTDKTLQSASLLQDLVADLEYVQNLYNSPSGDRFKGTFIRLFGVSSQLMPVLTRLKLGGATPDEYKEALFKAGGATTFNNVDNNFGVTFRGSQLAAAGNLDVKSDLSLIHSNIALGDASKGDVDTIGIGAAMIVDDIDNDNLISVLTSSDLKAGRDLTLDATTVQPGSKGKLNYGPKNKNLAITLDFDLDSGELGKFDIDRKDLRGYWLRPETFDKNTWQPYFYISDMFENQVSSFSKSKGSSFDVAASLLIAKADNNTRVDIQDSKVKSDARNLNIAAVNRISSHSGVGINEFSYDPSSGTASITDIYNTDGAGGGLYYRDSSNKADVSILDSLIDAPSGDVAIGSANDQLFLNLVKLGSKASTLGIAGSVNIQDVGGSTSVTVDGSQITGNDVTVAAGEADGVKDAVTVVDINGTYTNTEGETDTGLAAAVGAAVNIWNIDRNVNTVVGNSSITADGNTAVNAVSSDRIISLSMAGAFASDKNGAQGVSGEKMRAATERVDNESANRRIKETIDIPVTEGDGDAAPAADTELAVNNAGSSDNRSQFGLAVSGSVIVVMDDTDVTSDVNNSKISSQGKTDVTASMDNLSILGSGGFSDSQSIGAGAAAALYLRDGGNKVRAAVEGSEIRTGIYIIKESDEVQIKKGLTVSATDSTDIYGFVAGVGMVDSGSSAITLGGSFNYTTVKPTVESYIRFSTVKGQSEDKKADVLVNAESSYFKLGFSGGFTSASADDISIGASVAATADYMASNVSSYMNRGNLYDNIGDVAVTSSVDTELYGIGISASATTKAQTDLRFDGSLGLALLENNVNSAIRDTKIDAAGDVKVDSSNTADVTNLEGTFDFSGSKGSGLGVNGAVVIDKQKNTVSSVADARDGIKSGGDIKVVADSKETLNAIPVTAAISLGGSMTASNVVVNIVENEVSSNASGSFQAAKDVYVGADDESYILTRGGTVGITGGQGFSPDIALSVNYNGVAKTVDSSIAQAIVISGEDTSVVATSLDAVGASDGRKDEDEILVKDADGYYSELRTDKDFSKWNMFYNVAATTGTGASGSFIFDNTTNKVNASVKGESTITASNVKVLSLDNGIKNIMAGAAAGAEGFAALGLQVVWSENASDVKSTITDNTVLNVSDVTSVDARSEKDAKLVLIAAGADFGGGFSTTANGVFNKQNDNVVAGIPKMQAETGSLSVNAESRFDAVKVLAGATGSSFAVSVQPVVDKHKGTVDSYFENSDVVAKKGGVSVNSKSIVDTTDVLVSIVVAQNASLSGMGIGHSLENINRSWIDFNAKVDSAGAVEVSSVNDVDIDNWTMGAVAVSQGAALAANVIRNEVLSRNEAYLSSSEVTSGGEISVVAEGRKDIDNTAGAFGGSVQGATAGLNLIFNDLLDETMSNMVENSVTNSDNPVPVLVKAISDNDISNRTILATVNVEGVDANGAAVKTKVKSSNIANLDSLDTKGDVNVLAESNTNVSDTSVDAAFGVVGAGIAVNVFLMSDYGDSLAIIRGKVNANNINVGSRVNNSYNLVNVSTQTGLGAVGVNVTKVKFGNRTDNNPDADPANEDVYSEYEDKAMNQFEAAHIDNAGDGGTSYGVLAMVGDYSGVLKPNEVTASGNINVSAENIINDISLTNVDVAVGGLVGDVGVHSVELVNATSASIRNAAVTAGGDVTVSSSQKDNTSLTSVGVSVSGLNVSVAGGANAYDNSSETESVIRDSKVSAESGSVSVLSSVSTKADAVNDSVRASGASLNIANHQASVSAAATSLVTGNNEIKADALNIKSSGSMDLHAGSSVVEVSTLGMDLNENKVEGSATIAALIDQAEGEINVNRLNIATEYDKMKVSAENNIVSVAVASVESLKSNTDLVSRFVSGIKDSTDGLVVNSRETLIENAKYSDSANEFMTAEASVLGVEVSGISGAASSAIARNQAYSDTYLQVGKLNTGELVVDSNLRTGTTATSGSKYLTAIGAEYLVADGNNSGQLRIFTGGEINVEGKATFNSLHVTKSAVSLDSLSKSLLAGVDVMRINSEMESVTDVNIGGSLTAGEVVGNFYTERSSALDTSLDGSSIIKISNSSARNTVAGESNVTLGKLSLNSRKISISNISENTTDDISKSRDDGMFAFSQEDFKKDFRTNSKTVLHNALITNGDADHPEGSIDITVQNNNVIKDSSYSSGGGFVAFKDSKFRHKFDAGSEMIVGGSTVNAGTLNLSATSDIRTDTEDVILYSVSEDGFVTGGTLDLETTLNQRNRVTVNKGSKVMAAGNVNITTASGFSFKQEVSRKDDGFSSWPNGKSRLTSNNDNTVTVTEDSTVSAINALNINMDASGTLYTKTFAKARNLQGDKVKSDADVTLNVSNNLNVGQGGSAERSNVLHGGDLVSIRFMGNSVTNVSHESYAQCNAVAPDTKQDGETVKTVNNTFNLFDDGAVESGRDVDIRFDFGGGELSSYNHYKRVYYSWFGKTSKKSYTHNVVMNHNPVFNMAGIVSAGLSDSWEMEIATDGTIIKSVGFKPSSYEFIDATDAQDLKDQRIGLIEEEWNSLGRELVTLKTLEAYATASISSALDDLKIIGEMKVLPGSENIRPASEVRDIISADRKEILIDKYTELGGTAETAAALYDSIYEDYLATKGTDEGYEEMDEYVSAKVTDDLFRQAYTYSDEIIELKMYKISVANGDSENNIQFLFYDNGTKYAGRYDGATDIDSFLLSLDTAEGRLNDEYRSYSDMVRGYEKQITETEDKMSLVEQNLRAAEQLPAEYYEQVYGLHSVFFDDINRISHGSIAINGVNEDPGTNPDSDYPASLDPATGTGTIRIKGAGNGAPLKFYVGTGGIRIINNSDRSLMFGNISVKGDTVADKLVINGKVRNDLILSPNAGSPYVSGVTIMNLLDVTHPLYINSTRHDLSVLNNIVINGLLSTEGDQITLYSESGDINVASINYVDGRTTSISAPQGNVTLGGWSTDSGYVFGFGANDTITAGKKIHIKADTVDINGKLNAGVIVKKFVITTEKPEDHLVLDPFTGERILVDTLGDNNIKAIYFDQDGVKQFELFDIRETDGSVEISAVTQNQATGRIGEAAEITVNHGFSNIEVSHADAIPLVIGKIDNIRTADRISPALSLGDVENHGKTTVNVNDSADVDINATTDITVAGKILNSMQWNENGDLERYLGGNFHLYSSIGTGTVIVERVSGHDPTITAGSPVTVNNILSGDVQIRGGIESPEVDVSLGNLSKDTIIVEDLNNDKAKINTNKKDVFIFRSKINTYGSIQTYDKNVEVDNVDIRIKTGVGIKVYTDVVGSFSMKIDETNRVFTTAPAVYVRGDLVIENALGYHTFESLAYSEANTLETEVSALTTKAPSYLDSESLLDEEVPLIELTDEQIVEEVE